MPPKPRFSQQELEILYPKIAFLYANGMTLERAFRLLKDRGEFEGSESSFWRVWKKCKGRIRESMKEETNDAIARILHERRQLFIEAKNALAQAEKNGDVRAIVAADGILVNETKFLQDIGLVPKKPDEAKVEVSGGLSVLKALEEIKVEREAEKKRGASGADGNNSSGSR